MTHSFHESQRRAARIVGAAYLLALAVGVFAEFYVPGRIILGGSAAATARNIISHERLFRTGVAAELLVCGTDLVLITALYLVLEPVNRGIALLAALFRLVETAMLAVAALNEFAVLRIVPRADNLSAFDADRLHALAQLSLGAHGAAYSMSFVFFGIGSSGFCYLWFKAGYIPRSLAAGGIAASAWIGACALTFIVFPELSQIVTITYYGAPIFVFELIAGLWLSLAGLPAGAPPMAVAVTAQAP